ncbi:hypothetical protein BCR35DRAFT_85095 [Leucosporidium creatinivorum]|uniref:Membrane anchor Opy2 N-terminal domain-containing protein n=1 Tax=Leucosporidium creatinivorum TaxID=106004 RepID=A0A1Y2FG43_9BASI|nr:hypothetical protein BCR35DRAFT_85095 [Leucosporidium creatinivorum]
MSSNSGCLSCTDPIPACACSAGQLCQTVQRTCNQCSYNECYDSDTSSSSGGGSSIGTSVGGALGGVAAIAAALALIYWFWWKPRGLAASRRRYSKHLSHRASKMMPPGAAAGDKKVASPQGGTGVAKRSSVHLNIGSAADATLLRRAGSPGPGGRGETPSLPASVGATGGHSTRTSIDSDNPFGDHARSSIGTFADYPDDASTRTSDFSFRSSHSTNIIPIAYIPPHSNSLSVDDANRGAYGEVLNTDGGSSPSRSSVGRAPTRSSVPTSMASRDSLALAGAELIDLHPLPPVLSPGSPVVPFGVSANGAPIRPPRSPGLDLQLPQGSSTPTSPLNSPSARDSRLGVRPTSGFPFTSPPASGTPSFLSTPPDGASRGMSVLLEPRDGARSANSHLSTISSMSAATSRSAGSTMSYILDPPQIITPVNAQGLRRVEVMGRGHAGLVKISGSGGGSLPGTPAVDGIHPPTPSSSTSTASSPTTPKAFAGQPSISQQQAAADPFSDDHEASTARFSVGGIAAPSSSSNEALRARRESQDTITSSSSQPHSLDPSNASRWTTSSVASSSRRGSGESVTLELDPLHPGTLAHSPRGAGERGSFDVPHSARSSEAYEGEGDTGSRSRRLTTESSWTEGSSLLDGFHVHARWDSVHGSLVFGQLTSLLDQLGLHHQLLSRWNDQSPRFTSFPHATAEESIFHEHQHGRTTLARSRRPSHRRGRRGGSFGTLLHRDNGTRTRLSHHPTNGGNNSDEDSPLPAPFLPFAGQRPSSSSAPSETDNDNRDSQAISLRSGFASGLSDVAFRGGVC